MKPVSVMHYNTIITYITHYEHIYNALQVVMNTVRVTVNPGPANDYDYVAP